MARKKEKRKSSSLGETLGFNSIIYNEKLKFVTGLLLLVMAVYITLAFISFFTTGAADQSLIESPRAGELMNTQRSFQNDCGSIGAYTSYFFIKRCFGLPAFLIPFFLFFSAMKLMKVYNISIQRWFLCTMVIMLWMSVTFAKFLSPLFTDTCYNPGGDHGLFLCTTIENLVGAPGLTALIVVVALTFLVYISMQTVYLVRKILNPAKFYTDRVRFFVTNSKEQKAEKAPEPIIETLEDPEVFDDPTAETIDFDNDIPTVTTAKAKDDKADESKDKDKKDKDGKKEKSDKAKDAESKAKSDTTEAKKDSAEVFKPDFDRRHDRVARVTWISGSIGDFYLAKDGRKVYYIASYDGGYNLWVRDIDDGSLRVLNKGLGYCALLPSTDGKSLYTSGGRIRKVNLDNGSAKDINFRAEFEYKPIKEREYIFDHVVNLINNKFYREDLGGVDWDFYAKSYKRFLPEINNDYDMAEMLSEMLGELNASHTGARVGTSAPRRQTADLGAFFDDEYDGDGLKIKEVIKGGPLDFTGSKIKAGHIIKKIDGQPIEKGRDYFPLLAGKNDKRTLLVLTDGNGKNEYEQEVIPQTLGQVGNLLYKRWVERRREMTEKYSGGRVGYVHVRAMDSESFRDVFSEVLGKNPLEGGN